MQLKRQKNKSKRPRRLLQANNFIGRRVKSADALNKSLCFAIKTGAFLLDRLDLEYDGRTTTRGLFYSGSAGLGKRVMIYRNTRKQSGKNKAFVGSSIGKN